MSENQYKESYATRPRKRRENSLSEINFGDSRGRSLSTIEDKKYIKKMNRQTSKSKNKVWIIALITSLIPILAYRFGDSHTKDALEPFLFVSYKQENGRYGKGLNDILFVMYFMIVLTFLREFVMQVVLAPLSVLLETALRGKRMRFMEQAYSLLYYAIAGPAGLWIMSRMPELWYFRTAGFYEAYPHFDSSLELKLFYLLQAAFWAQQSVLLCLQVEKPRKDFHELVFHHIITMALIICSYRFHFQYMGLAVYVTMDISDFFLAMSKLSSYLDSKATPFVFTIFLFVWAYLRHYLNLKILWSVLTEFRTVGPFELSFADQQYKCWISQIITFVLIFALQIVNLYWFFLICRIGYRLAVEGAASDVRSDDEDENDDEDGE
ncbi:hypothetical protein CANCADRAFT_3737 [Tortispora caseinolytica NRRL Y-17796]|uniref:TLC domain-containing protein n=1 Tax=Tortispora caseinolytica NRRL Y-17796 TaxID=767744 RepID=A0A1E4TBG7_9ASCO|nr:hypothetical protein CANCADRAFT_3737 [Tortispora caseinolytica NRRL Y-17796]